MARFTREERLSAEIQVLRMSGFIGNKRMFALNNPRKSIAKLSDERLIFYIAAYEEEYESLRGKGVHDTKAADGYRRMVMSA